jgi:hypothetical protein
MKTPPQSLTVNVMDVGEIEVPNSGAFDGDINRQAFAIMTEGLRLFDLETRRATFYPPWRIIEIEVQFPPLEES